MTGTTHVDHPVRQALSGVEGKTFGHVINGVAESAGGAGLLDVLNPSTGEVIAQVTRGTVQDVDRAVSAARQAFPAWRATPPAVRAQVLTAIAAVIDEHLDELEALESLNVGKPLSVSHEEMPGVGEVFRFMAGAARALQTPAPHEYTTGYLSMIRREPVGVIGAVTPWNYPLLTASWKIAAALAMGNAIVVKPSELTPLTLLRFMALIADIVPAGLVNVVVGTGPEVGSAISHHPGIDLVTLTGSVASGQQVVSDSARTLKPTHLELGGKAPVLVFADASLANVVETIGVAGFYNSGQECGAATRVICHSSIRAELTALLVARAAAIVVGSPTEGDIEMGPLVRKVHLDRVAAMVTRARDAGATIAVGGTPLGGEGFFFPPTVITSIPPGSEIIREEIFGPVITIETFETESEAVTLANDTVYGLAASVWTESVGRAVRLTGELDFGTVWVNTHLLIPTEMPWGGFGASGSGRECSTLGLEDFSRTKHVMIATGATGSAA
jgi:1-pyrroline dehydrogenase